MFTLGLIHHHKHHITGILNRQGRHKAADLGSWEIDPIEGLLRRSCFATNSVAGCFHTLATALIHHRFHPLEHRARDLGVQQLLTTGCRRRSQGITRAEATGDVGTDQLATVGQHPVQLNQLERCERKPLTKGRRRRLDRLAGELLLALELTSHRSREVGVRTLIDAKTLHPVPVGVVVETAHGLDHADVA